MNTNKKQYDSKWIEVPTNKGGTTLLRVDSNFDTTALDGVVFEYLFDSVAVYQKDGKYRGNHTFIGSMNELFGVPRGAKRTNAYYYHDYRLAAWGIVNNNHRVGLVELGKTTTTVSLTVVERIIAWIIRFVAPYFY